MELKNKIGIDELSYILWGIISEYLFYEENLKVSLINKALNQIIIKDIEISSTIPILHYFKADLSSIEIHYLQRNANFTFKIRNLKVKDGEVIHSPRIEGFDSVQVGHQIFLSGGTNVEREYLKTTLEFGLGSKMLHEKSEMEIGKYFHYLLCLNKSKVYSLCGLGENGLLNECEEYSVREDKWIGFYKTNERKCSISGSQFKQRYLFIFGGENAFSVKYIQTIEKIDLQSNIGWLVVELLQNEGWKENAFSSAIQIAGDAILVFGGEDAFKTQLHVFEFYPDFLSIRKLENEALDSPYYNAKPLYFDDSVYTYIDHSRSIMKYHCHHHSWSSVSVE